MKSTISFVAWSCLLCVLGVVGACQDDHSVEPAGNNRAAPGPAGKAGAPPDDALEAFFRGACGEAIAQVCTTPFSTCQADPTCAQGLPCLRQCVASDGSFASECVQDCGDPADAATPLAWLTECLSRVKLERSGEASAASGDCWLATSDQADLPPLLQQSCPSSTNANLCHRCEEASCCENDNECSANAACSGFNRCIQDCVKKKSLHECNVDCDAAHPGGLAKYAPLLTCMTFRCSNDTCGDGPWDSCERCLYGTECAASAVACRGEPRCYLLSSCYAACDTFDRNCKRDCFDTYPEAKEQFEDSTACGLYHCFAVCQTVDFNAPLGATLADVRP